MSKTMKKVECAVCMDSCLASRAVVCHACDVPMCTPCAKNCVLAHPMDPKCTNPECGVKWDKRFLHSQFTKVWLSKDFQTAVNNAYIAFDKSEFANTLRHIELKKTEIIAHRIEQLERFYTSYYSQAFDYELRVYDMVKNDLKPYLPEDEDGVVFPDLPTGEKRNETIRRNTDLKVRKFARLLKFDYDGYLAGNGTNYTFMCPCPGDCKGAILKSTRTCVLCHKTVCPKCLTYTSDGRASSTHVCDEETVKSVKVIVSESRPCPQCGVFISKNGGCDQLWCSQCKVVFSWVTGAIDHGKVHNPHALQWLQETRGSLGRDPGDVPCGGYPDKCPAILLTRESRQSILKAFRLRTCPESIHTFFTHTINRGIDAPEHIRLITTEIRSTYLLGRITEKKYNQTVIAYAKRREKSEVLSKALLTLRNVAVDRFKAIHDEDISLDEFWEDIHQLVLMTNEMIRDALYPQKRVPRIGIADRMYLIWAT